MTKYNYDEDADVLYISFSRSEHVTGIELAPNVLLRLDSGKADGGPPRAVGLTLISYSRMREKLQGQPLTISLENLRNLPDDIRRAVVTVVTSPPASEVLGVAFTISLPASSLPELATA
ncbi:MAG: DUF2283 domain-containing protein [Chloroflexi bacterium]|nr:DUF2283 domain-containing protein [Chloroflexota bacterium]MBI3762707.1 DUF2283 domain-containing protein [Chloroflexota bacterium]